VIGGSIETRWGEFHRYPPLATTADQHGVAVRNAARSDRRNPE